jgi:hypothetical protein
MRAMNFREEDAWPRRWTFVVGVIVLCWVLSLLSILSWLILPLLGYAIFRVSRRGAWLPLFVLLVSNPTGVWFIHGMVDYARGAPKLRYMGLPSMEFYNIDPKTRCFRRTGGCIVRGNEWVSHDFHNLGVGLLAAACGAPSRSYDGPYPTKEEAMSAVANAPKLDLAEFVNGRIQVGGSRIELNPKMVTDLSTTVGVYGLMDGMLPDGDLGTFAQAVVFQERCLILRIVEQDTSPTTTSSPDQDFLILMDLKCLRPFAYYRIHGDRARRFPKVQYLLENSR